VRRRGLVASLFGIIAIAVVALGATLVAGRTPLLGLDLRGGVSVVLQPQGKVSANNLQQAVDIIDRRVNGLGVANSSVQRQGNDVVIELPGAKNSQKALKIIGATAQLFFRPVYCTLPAYVAAGKAATKPRRTTTTHKPTKAASPSTTVKSSAPAGAAPAELASKTSTATTVPASTATTVPSSTSTTPTVVSPTGKLSSSDCSAANAASIPSTSPDNDVAGATVLLPSSPDMGITNGDRWLLGPADLTGEIVKSASAAVDTSNNQYVVNVTLNGKGLAGFNKVAAVRNKFYQASASSQPFDALEAIELDGVVESTPAIENSTFAGPVQITGAFTSSQASNLALELNYGSLPVRFNPQSVETVSAQIGSDSLKAGLLAGLGGIVVVLLYMIAYYRALGFVVVLGLGVGGALLFSILTELSYTSNLALTLSGVTGIIVSIGITVDSYIVYFERLKDEIRSGKTVRASVERGFSRAFRTVLTADLVSFMAALILYLFTVGDVRGFAFTLGLSTLLDVFTAFFFIRPIVILLGRRRGVSGARVLGIARGLGVNPAGGAS
jgi:preprotein translocase subunit SecD